MVSGPDPADEAAAVREEEFFQRRYWAAQALNGVAAVFAQKSLEGAEFETDQGEACGSASAVARAAFNIADAMILEEARRAKAPSE